MNMKRFARFLPAACILGGLGLLATLYGTPEATAAGSAPVHIVSPVPLPVSVENPVSIVNDGSTPLPVTVVGDDGLVPFQTNLATSSLPTGTTLITGDVDVPDGKILVLDHASAYTAVPPGQVPEVEIVCNSDTGGTARHSLLLEPLGSDGFGRVRWMANEEMTCYGKSEQGLPGLRVTVFRIDDTGTAGPTGFSISGHLVPAPQP